MEADTVSETLGHNSVLTWLVARDDFIWISGLEILQLSFATRLTE
jgi:hypothetical protein